MSVQDNLTLSGVAYSSEELIDVNKAFNVLMLYQESLRFSKLSIDQNMLKIELIDLLYQEGLISKETCYTAKKLAKEV